jgi:aryl-alcohol dehydrogenase-like predicted oxidoreductase
MKTIRINQTTLDVSRIGYGAMNLGGEWDKNPLSVNDRRKASAAVDTALEQGITLFDHADIYTYGKSEAVFGEILELRPA